MSDCQSKSLAMALQGLPIDFKVEAVKESGRETIEVQGGKFDAEWILAKGRLDGKEVESKLHFATLASGLRRPVRIWIKSQPRVVGISIESVTEFASEVRN
jgi:hypothetical protein